MRPDRHALERNPGARERGVLGCLVVGAAEPAGARQRRSLGDARERLALALRPRLFARMFRGDDLVDLRHTGSRVRSAALMTSLIT
jgi:hypothetical protein